MLGGSIVPPRSLMGQREGKQSRKREAGCLGAVDTEGTLNKAYLRPKARRTGPSMPASIACSADRQLPPPCLRVCCAQQSAARMEGKLQPQLMELQESMPQQTELLHGNASSLMRTSQPAHAAACQQQQQQQQPMVIGVDIAHSLRMPLPDLRFCNDQQPQSGWADEHMPVDCVITVAESSPRADGHAPAAVASAAAAAALEPAAPRKAVRFAPGPLPASSPAVGFDGHPVGEGRVARPVRQFSPGSFTSDLSRSNLLALEQLLGPENAPSLERLKRRLVTTPNRPPRVQLTARRRPQATQPTA